MTTAKDRHGNPIIVGNIATGNNTNHGGQITGPIHYVDEDSCGIVDEGSADEAVHGFASDQVEMQG